MSYTEHRCRSVLHSKQNTAQIQTFGILRSKSLRRPIQPRRLSEINAQIVDIRLHTVQRQ